MSTQSKKWFEVDAPSARRGEPAWLAQARRAAFDRYNTLGFPDRKQEGWKYIGLESILSRRFGGVPANRDKHDAQADIPDLERCSWTEPHACLVFVNGSFRPALSQLPALPEGVVLQDWRAALLGHPDRLQQMWTGTAAQDNDVFSALNTVCFEDGILLFVPKDTEVAFPVHLVWTWQAQAEAAIYPRCMIHLEEGARARVVWESLDAGESPHFMSSVSDVFVGRGARLDWEVVQRKRGDSFEMFSGRCRLAEAAALRGLFFSSGGSITRNEMTVELEGRASDCRLQGLSVLRGRAQVFHHATVRHRVGGGSSEQVAKNILADESQAEFNSLVHVCRDAQGSRSRQINRNLILSQSAIAHSRPQLRIDADDVQANHGSATGQLEPGEIFYLRSRGIDERSARRVLMEGFAEEILAQVEPFSLREDLRRLVACDLDAVAAGAE